LRIWRTTIFGIRRIMKYRSSIKWIKPIVYFKRCIRIRKSIIIRLKLLLKSVARHPIILIGLYKLQRGKSYIPYKYYMITKRGIFINYNIIWSYYDNEIKKYDRELKRNCVIAFTRIFRLINTDNNNLINRQELSIYNQKTFNSQLSEQEFA
jgi:hypothetical protein